VVGGTGALAGASGGGILVTGRGQSVAVSVRALLIL
jgi:hypothetical protein